MTKTGWILTGLVALFLLGASVAPKLIGGAIASHLRVGSPLPTHTLFGVYLGIAMWLGLWLRDARLRAYFRGP